MEQTKIKKILEQETFKRKDLQLKMNEYELREKEYQLKILELENKVNENIDKEIILKENLNVMENQVNRISEMFQEK